MLFDAIAIALAGIVAFLLVRTLLRSAGPAAVTAAADMTVWRAQLAEVDRDLARGVLSGADAARTRTEIARRILEADRAMAAPEPAGTVPRGVVWFSLVLVAGVLAGGFVLYGRIGAPGYPDLPLAARLARSEEIYQSRPPQAEAEAAAPKPARPAADPEQVKLMDQLRAAVAGRPDDLQGHELLARNEAAMGNFSAAAVAQARVIALKGAGAAATDHAAEADALILATGGYVSPEAEAALKKALDLDPRNGTARFYMGLMFAQNGRPDLTFKLWRPLLEDGPQDAPWIPVLRDQITGIAAAAGVDYAPPSGLPGPDAGAMAAAADMSEADRQAMIRTMVKGLEDRLTTGGGSPEEWARLLGALMVLGEKDHAAAMRDAALAAFAGQDAALATIRDAATQAGIAP